MLRYLQRPALTAFRFRQLCLTTADSAVPAAQMLAVVQGRLSHEARNIQVTRKLTYLVQVTKSNNGRCSFCIKDKHAVDQFQSIKFANSEIVK